MKKLNNIKLKLILANILLFGNKISAEFVGNCNYDKSTNKCKNLNIKDAYCYDTTSKNIYLTTDENGSCTSQVFNGNIFLTDSNDLISNENDTIQKGYSCKNGLCSEITNSNLYDNISNPEYYVYYDNATFKQLKASKYAVYLIKENPAILVTCGNNNLCRITNVSSNSYYINYENTIENHLISCEEDNQKTITCTDKSDPTSGYYINSGPDKLSKPIIFCDSNICNALSINGNSYYLNAASKTPNTDSLIYCSNSSCSIVKSDDDQYYIGTNNEDNILIFCNEDGCSKSGIVSDRGYYKNSGVNNRSYPLIHCSDLSSCSFVQISEPGYYIDNGNPGNIFYCSDTCQSKEIDPTSVSTLSTPGKAYIANNYIVLIGNFNEQENEYDNLYTSSDELLYYLSIEPQSGFPGVNAKIKTLFRITPNSITRVAVNGIISVNDSSHKINLNSANLSEGDSLYKCTKSRMICEKTNNCTTKTYFLDENNKTAFMCENNKLEVISSGYYVDNGRDNNPNSGHLIYCRSPNDCISVSNPSNYYINGAQSTQTLSKTNTFEALIYCNNNFCSPVSAKTGGFYVAGNSIDLASNGYIYCSSVTTCELRKSNNESYFINSGSNKNVYGIIKCTGGKCYTISGGNGYFISGNPEELIYCENSSNCSTIKASTGFYNAVDEDNDGDNKKIIECTAKLNVVCEKKNASKGYYISNTNNVLINCMGKKCKTIYATNGIFRGATVTTTTTKRDTQTVYNIITCTNTGCSQLSASELSTIPICTFDNNKCFITTKFTTSTSPVTSIASGGYCTNLDHSVIYFATDTVVIDPYIIDGTTSIYVTTTTTSNCIEVSDEYSSYYYTINGSIYRISDGRITQETRSGYYFINVETNVLASGTNIEEYNNSFIKLFKCNDNSCYVVDNPTTITYYTDVNKRIIRYDPNSDSYSFPYEKDVICIYDNNKCTPNEDLKSKEFCITYRGELVLASTDIKSRETADCYKSNNIVSYIFGHSQHLYEMNSNSAQMVETTGYYIISLSTNSTASYKDYINRNNIIKIYGCVSSVCNEYKPIEGVYYYDYLSKSMYKYENKVWSTPSISGYALASIIPDDLYIYKFITNMNKVTLEGKAISGYYYTVDNEMYDCSENTGCEKISDNGYYFTNNGEIFYCLYDSEGLEKTTCIKQNCYIGEYYYIDGIYYRCESGSIYNYISAKYCNYNEKVVVNFPTAINSNYPSEVHNAINNISRHNNSTAIINSKINNYLTIIPGVFTNCTYNYEAKSSNFDLLCINNFVTLDDDDNPQICSVSQLGFIECIEDDTNKNKCNPSSAFSRYTVNISFTLLIISLIHLLLFI